MSLPVGSRLDHYEIVRSLGHGGMGEVFLARDTDLNRTVAIKVLPPDVTSDPHRVARFEQEARAASALNHPNVCTIHALGRTEDGRRYIAMEHVEGETLRARLVRGRLPLREALDIATQMASAVSAAHAIGIVHRDIKPENAMIRRDRFVKVLDFGLAKLLPSGDSVAADEATRTVAMTDPGALVGTVAYMSPEQARGEAVDARTDIWALGVVLYQMLTGRAPFTGATRSDVLVAILDREPPSLGEFQPNAPPELQRIVRKALQKDPDRRYQVTKDFLLDLQSLSDDDSSSAMSSAVNAPPVRQRRRSTRTWLFAAALMLVVAAFGVRWWINRQKPPPVAASPTAGSLARLTFGPGLQTDAAFSPDGRFVAYASDSGGNFDIWVQAVSDTGKPHQVTTSSASDTQPSWSPDGRSLVFRSERDGGGLFIVPVDGGAERQLTSFGIHPQWLANGAEIFFRTGFEEWVSDAYIVSPDGDAPRKLAAGFLDGGGWNWIAPHPDGRISALGLHPTRKFGFFTVTRDGRTVTASRLPAEFPLRFTETGTRLLRFQWNSRGDSLFVEAMLNEVRNVWKVHVDSRTLDWIDAKRLTIGTGPDTAAALSSAGTSIAFTSVQQVSRLWSFPFNATEGRILGEGTPITPADGIVETFAMSPDGRRVAYFLRPTGGKRWELLLTDIDARKTEIFGVNALPGGWSSDGNTLAYNPSRPDLPPPGEWALAARRVDGPERIIKRWSSSDALLATGFTPDGQYILGSYVSPLYTGQFRVALWPATTGAAHGSQRIIAADPNYHLHQPSFSADGRWLAFLAAPRERRLNAIIFVTPAAGAPRANWTRIVGGDTWVDKPRWAPDGRALYFISNRGSSFFNLWGIRFDRDRGIPVGEPFAITKFDSPGFILSPNVTAAEIGVAQKRAVLTMTTVSGGIWMLESVDR
jgi:eukaryotic-like serine/threonine-protein kinase